MHVSIGRRIYLMLTAIGLITFVFPITAAGDMHDESGGRVFEIENLTYPQIDELDRNKSVFILTFGNLEQHGPHLPIGADAFQAVSIRDGVVDLLRKSHPEYDIVLVPVIPLGEGGAEDFARDFDHIGTYAVRFSTLRAVAIDMGWAIAERGFTNILLIHHHGAPLHNVAFNDAADFISQRFGVRMANVSSLAWPMWEDEPVTEALGEGWQEEVGVIGHSGTGETSVILHLAKDLVDPDYINLPPFYVPDAPALRRIHERDDWQGYWSDPSKATASLGEGLLNSAAKSIHRVAVMVLNGDDLSELSAYPYGEVDEPERYIERQKEIDAWFAARKSNGGS